MVIKNQIKAPTVQKVTAYLSWPLFVEVWQAAILARAGVYSCKLHRCLAVTYVLETSTQQYNW